MVGGADLWTLCTTAAQLDTCVRLRANKLGIQRRPTKRGCRAGRLVRQRHPAADINAAESENETDAPYSTPIPVIYPSRCRATRSAARCRSASLSVDNTSATYRRPDDECDNVSQSSSSSAANKQDTTACGSWRSRAASHQTTSRQPSILRRRSCCVEQPAIRHSIRTASTLSTFKNRLKTHLFLPCVA